MTQNMSLQEMASFDTQWSAAAYLHQYYSAVENDEKVTIRFLVDVAAQIPDVPILLEFGCGPTVHHLFPFAERAEEIHVADYLACNLDSVRRWVEQDGGAHDWSAFADYSVRCERGRAPTRMEVCDRESLTRRRITAFHRADARHRQPLLDIQEDRTYPAVLCCFCPDSITDDLAEWQRCTANVASLVAPGGWLILAALRRAASYRVGRVQFPSAFVTEDAVALTLREAGFPDAESIITTADVADDRGYGFTSLILAVSRRS